MIGAQVINKEDVISNGLIQAALSTAYIASVGRGRSGQIALHIS